MGTSYIDEFAFGIPDDIKKKRINNLTVSHKVVASHEQLNRCLLDALTKDSFRKAFSN